MVSPQQRQREPTTTDRRIPTWRPDRGLSNRTTEHLAVPPEWQGYPAAGIPRAATILALQRTMGNRAVNQLLTTQYAAETPKHYSADHPGGGHRSIWVIRRSISRRTSNRSCSQWRAKKGKT